MILKFWLGKLKSGELGIVNMLREIFNYIYLKKNYKRIDIFFGVDGVDREIGLNFIRLLFFILRGIIFKY